MHKWHSEIYLSLQGVYAISVQGRLPQSIVSDLRRSGIVYKSRDTSKM